MKHYTVCTPQYMTYGGSWTLDPPEYGADCVAVEAPNKRAAKVAAVREMRKQGMDWVQDQQSDRASPFRGLEVFEEVCPHGICHCDICARKSDWEQCETCYEEAIKEADEALSYKLSESKE